MPFTSAIFYKRPKVALAWLEKAFGFETTMLIEGPEGNEEMMHSEMSFAGRGRIMVGAEWAEWVKSPLSVGGGNTQSLHVQLDDTGNLDAHCERARSAGAVISQEPQMQFYGDKTYRCRDPEGHMWTFAQTVKKMTVAEMEEAGGVKIKGSL